MLKKKVYTKSEIVYSKKKMIFSKDKYLNIKKAKKFLGYRPKDIENCIENYFNE